MEPKSLSASAVQSFEGCEARYKAEYIDKVPDLQGEAAGLGSACHGALEDFVKSGQYLTEDFKVLEVHYSIHYYNYFSEPNRYDEGLKMLRDWYDRQVWTGRKVLSTEVKETFDLKFTTSDGREITLPFTYIWDRCDSLKDDTEIEVVDYKSVVLPVSPDEMKRRIQVRSYALAAQIKYPDAKRIWVSFDLLRYDKVGVSFTREDNIATWRYLQQVGRRVWDSNGTTEKLNAECRWCVRKSMCTELFQHVDGGGVMGVNDVDAAIDMRALIDFRQGALRNLQAELDDFILTHMEDQNVTELRTNMVEVRATMRSTRVVDREDEILELLPHDLVAKYGSINVTSIDKLLKEPGLDDDIKSVIKSMIRKNPGKVYLKTKSLTDLDRES